MLCRGAEAASLRYRSPPPVQPLVAAAASLPTTYSPLLRRRRDQRCVIDRRFLAEFVRSRCDTSPAQIWLERCCTCGLFERGYLAREVTVLHVSQKFLFRSSHIAAKCCQRLAQCSEVVVTHKKEIDYNEAITVFFLFVLSREDTISKWLLIPAYFSAVLRLGRSSYRGTNFLPYK